MTKLPPQSLAFALSDEMVENLLLQLVSVAQVPEIERGGVYASVARYSRERHHTEHYDLARVAGIFRQLAHVAWVGWPRQESLCEGLGLSSPPHDHGPGGAYPQSPAPGRLG